MTSLPPPPFTIQTVSLGTDLDHIRTLLREYTAHLHTVIDPTLIEHRESELAHLPGSFAPPRGALLLASSTGRPVGCAALRPISLPNEPTAAEFCRLWVSPPARGHALGSHLLAAAITIARTAGHTAIVLNSIAGIMDPAQSIYTRAGFVPIPPYKQIPIPGIQFFRLDLTT